MYAIRSYYEYRKLQREIVAAENNIKSLDKETKDLGTSTTRALNNVGDNFVITSYSIHYTKLYEKSAKEQADKDMANGTEVNQEQYRKLQREIVAVICDHNTNLCSYCYHTYERYTGAAVQRVRHKPAGNRNNFV